MNPDADPPSIVNLGELAEMMGVSEKTLAALIHDNADSFPVVARGSKGVPYEFEPAAVARWWRDHKTAVDDATAKRRAQLAQMRLDLFAMEDESPELHGLTPAERKAEMEARLLEIKLRERTGQLVEAGPLGALLAEIAIGFRTGMMQVPIEFARAEQLTREQRTRLNHLIESQLGELARRFSTASGPPNRLAAE